MIRYKLIVAPMFYIVRPGVVERIEEFVSKGGTFVDMLSEKKLAGKVTIGVYGVKVLKAVK